MIKRWLLLMAPLVAIPVAAVARVAASVDTWPISRGDAALSGTTPARPPSKPVLRWRYEAKAKLLAAPVIQTAETRANRIEQFLETTAPYNDEGQTYRESVTDLLADVRHFCDRWDIDFGAVDRLAYLHYTEEKGR